MQNRKPAEHAEQTEKNLSAENAERRRKTKTRGNAERRRTGAKTPCETERRSECSRAWFKKACDHVLPCRNIHALKNLFKRTTKAVMRFL